MEYSIFCEGIVNELQRMMGEDYTVKLENVVKNNHVTYDAVVILKKDKHLAPSVCLEPYFERYRQGANITDIGLSIIVEYERYKDSLDFDAQNIVNYEKVQKNIYVKAINTNMNMELLNGMPHMKYYDLSMIAYVIVEDDGIHRATMNVTDSHLKLWNMDKASLFKDAINNTRKKMPPKIEKMSDIMKEILINKIRRWGYNVGDDMDMDVTLMRVINDIELSENDKMYVLTNSRKLDGAVYLLFGDVLEDIAELIEADLYIIPSSVHEVMILPKDEKSDYAELSEIVSYVNEKDLEPMEVLSDTIYTYERGKGIIWDTVQ